MKLALIQMEGTADREKNLQTAEFYLAEAAAQGADLAMLPEMFLCPYQTDAFPKYAEEEGGPSWQRMSADAKKDGLILAAGSMPEKDGQGRIYNTAYVFDRSGKQIARHRKMHLFDIAVEGGQHFRESETLTAGDDVTVFDTEFGRMGLAVCYDMRFPEAFGEDDRSGSETPSVSGFLQHDDRPCALGTSPEGKSIRRAGLHRGMQPGTK
jgi:predicted amidohydrolase